MLPRTKVRCYKMDRPFGTGLLEKQTNNFYILINSVLFFYHFLIRLIRVICVPCITYYVGPKSNVKWLGRKELYPNILKSPPFLVCFQQRKRK